MQNSIFLDLLGVHILVDCEYPACAQEIKNHFSQFLSTSWRSPDIIIECKLKQAERKLFRAVDAETALDDIHIYLPEGYVKEWLKPSPLLPPYHLAPFKNRFVGLHAAAIDTGKGALIIAADRTHGKTTSAIHLVNFHHCHLLADETTHIYKRSVCVEPFPTAISIFNTQASAKKITPAEDVCKSISKKPTSIRHILFLEKNIQYETCHMTDVTAHECLQLLLKHHVDLGCNKDEAMHTLFHLAKNISASKFNYYHYDDLIKMSASWVNL